MRVRVDSVKIACAVAAVTLLVFAAGPARAGDGVIEINQAKALAGGVTPSDGPGFPVTLDAPGSYRLTGNLTVGSVNVTAVELGADGISIDLNGFRIEGPTACSGTPPICTPESNTGWGIGEPFRRETKVLNGGISGFDFGLFLGPGSRIEAVQASSNLSVGILTGDSSTVQGSTAIYNGTHGITAGLGSVLTGNTARFNGAIGIATSPAATLIGNAASNNGLAGIDTSVASTVKDNTSFDNGTDGISAYANCTISGNTLSFNGRHGVYLPYGDANVVVNVANNNAQDGIHVEAGVSGVGARIHGNLLKGNGDDGIETSTCTGCSVTGNTIIGNQYGLFPSVDTVRGGNVISGSTNLDIFAGPGILIECDVVGGARTCPP